MGEASVSDIIRSIELVEKMTVNERLRGQTEKIRMWEQDYSFKSSLLVKSPLMPILSPACPAYCRARLSY